MKKRAVFVVIGVAGVLIVAVLAALAWLSAATQEEALTADG